MAKKILLAVDTASNVSAAVSMARDLACGSVDRVVVLHVHEYAVGRFGRIQVDCPEGEGERVANAVVADLRAAGVAAETMVIKTPVGQVARAILSDADDLDAWLILLGSTSGHDVPSLPFGSVSLRLLHKARRPVLITPKVAVGLADKLPVAAGAAG
jgi:nucleotide-binding universal stress UspA family protein